MRNHKLQIYSYKEDLNLYLTLCDGNMSLGLFKTDGSFEPKLKSGERKIARFKFNSHEFEINEEACLEHPYQPHTLRHYTGALTDIRPAKTEFYF